MILAQQSTFCLEEENNVEKECVNCETISSAKSTDSRSITNVPKEEEIPFKEAPFGNVYFSREAFHSLNYSTYHFVYPNLFNGLILHEATQYHIQINFVGPTRFEVLDGVNLHMEDTKDIASSLELSKFYEPFYGMKGIL